MAKRSPKPVDVKVGARIRLARLEIGISQGELGRKLGVTFQQVQKYERGANRVGASRLQQISDALDRPIAWFFEAAPASHKPEGDMVMQMLVTPHGVDLARAFIGLASNLDRITLVRLAERFVQVDAAAPRTVKRKAA